MKRFLSRVGGSGVIVACGLVLVLWSGSLLRAQQGGGGGMGPGQGMGMMRNAPALPVTEEEAAAPVEDMRIYVPMPPEARKIMRDQMKQFLVSLSRIQGMLADGKLAEAGELAENTMGRTERGTHRGQGPGRYMPPPMRNLAWTMHETASAFAETAAGGDVTASYKALQKVQNSCVACHLTYRNR